MNLEKEVFELAIGDIMPNRFQPREVFDDESINELAQSIKEHGVIQPIIVRKIGDKYEIVAGERRFRASQAAGKQTIPALIRNIDDKESAKIALLENLQRKNLTAIEEAKTYQTILKLDNLTQEELAKNLGKSQSAIANKLRLLNLDPVVQQALLNGQISERHARSLLNIDDKEKQKEELNKIIMNRMTVKQLDDEISLITGKTFTNDEEEINSNNDQNIFPVKEEQSFNNIEDNMAKNIETTNDINGNIIPQPGNKTVQNDVITPNNFMNNNKLDDQNISPVKEAQPFNNIGDNVVKNIEATNDINANIIPQSGNEAVQNNVITPNYFMDNYNDMDETNDLTKPIGMLEEKKEEEQPFNSAPVVPQSNNGTSSIESQSVAIPIEANESIIEGTPYNINLDQLPSEQPAVDSTLIMPQENKVNNSSITSIPSNMTPVEPASTTGIDMFANIEKLMNNVQTEQAPQISASNNETSSAIPNISEDIKQETLEPTAPSPTNSFSVEKPVITENVSATTIPNFPLPSSNSNVTANSNNVYDLRFAINNFRQAVQNTEKFGFNIDVEEFDFDNIYQIVIKIDKDKQ